MWDAYWQTARTNWLDWFIVFVGLGICIFHFIGFYLRWQGKRVLFVQDLDHYRTFLLMLTELLPVLGLLGTVLSLMYTFKTFQVGAQGEPLDLSQMVHAFAPAMSTTISGLMMTALNLSLNAIMWFGVPRGEKGAG